MSGLRGRRVTAVEAISKLQSINDDDSGAESERDDEFDDNDEENNDNESDFSLVQESLSDDSDETDLENELIMQHVDDSISTVMNRAFIGDDGDDTRQYISKDGTVWSKIKANEFTKQRNRIAFTEKAGPTVFAERRIDETALSSFFCIFDHTILKMITHYTNEEARSRNFDSIVSDIDILLFIAVLFTRGVLCQKLSVKMMWSSLYGPPLVRMLLSRDKFLKIMRFIRFDSKNERKTRVGQDRFVMIRELWERFISNSIASYKPYSSLTVDEQLLPCKSRCSFIQYMPNKPDKFGIKFWLLCDVETKYTCNGFPYLGKNNEKRTDELQGEFVVKKLIEPFSAKGYCVTTDNFFSSMKLAESLLQMKTKFLGTMKRNKKEIPEIAKENRKTYETMFLDNQNGCMLTSYQCKPKKQVILISTQHEQAVIPQLLINEKKKKPISVLSYNSQKVGVDSVDQMTRQYNVRAPTRRWPVSVFYNILNLAAINSWILYYKVNNNSISRSKFILKLVEEIKDLANKEKMPITTTPQQKRKAHSQSNLHESKKPSSPVLQEKNVK